MTVKVSEVENRNQVLTKLGISKKTKDETSNDES